MRVSNEEGRGDLVVWLGTTKSLMLVVGWVGGGRGNLYFFCMGRFVWKAASNAQARTATTQRRVHLCSLVGKATLEVNSKLFIALVYYLKDESI